MEVKQPRFEANELVRAWQAFSYDDGDGIAYTIRRGARGSHYAVREYPWNFVSDAAADNEEPSPFPLPEKRAPRFSGPVKVKAKQRVLYGAATFEPGQTFECDARNAEWLVSENYAEVA